MFEDLKALIAAIHSKDWKAAARIILKWAMDFVDNPTTEVPVLPAPLLRGDSDDDVASYLEGLSLISGVQSQFGGGGAFLKLLLPILLNWLMKKLAAGGM